MIRAARLDASLYEEVEADKTATTQALTVVTLSSICSGIGTAISQALAGQGLPGIGIGLIGGLLTALLVWAVWSFITYFVGTYVFGGTASSGELLRTIGFSDSPGVLLIFSFIPILGGIISVAVWVWGLVAMIIALRQALDFSTGKAVLTCIIGWIAGIILLVVIGVFLAIPFIFLGT
ncbi:MAG: YIP1 family protein [Candidatus Bathyarchaeota archaeon]|nr:MAG: YIP1 family protein [Candidatus Bathyarchaeota archaeon]